MSGRGSRRQWFVKPGSGSCPRLTVRPPATWNLARAKLPSLWIADRVNRRNAKFQRDRANNARTRPAAGLAASRMNGSEHMCWITVSPGPADLRRASSTRPRSADIGGPPNPGSNPTLRTCAARPANTSSTVTVKAVETRPRLRSPETRPITTTSALRTAARLSGSCTAQAPAGAAPQIAAKARAAAICDPDISLLLKVAFCALDQRQDYHCLVPERRSAMLDRNVGFSNLALQSRPTIPARSRHSRFV